MVGLVCVTGAGTRLMLARQGQERILDQVRAIGGVRVSDLAEVLNVSDMTIRRDIAVLAGKGVVSRVHGGVTNSVPVEEVFHTRPREDRTVILTGGVRTPSDALVGPVAVAALRGLHAD